MCNKEESENAKLTIVKTLQKICRWIVLTTLVFFIIFTILSNWFARQPHNWILEKCRTWPSFLTSSLLYVGEPFADITDSLGITGSDAECELEVSPARGVFFAGPPIQKNTKNPHHIRIIDKGEFVIGYSDTLCHPLWCAFKIPQKAAYPETKRPGFRKDKAIKSSPKAADYSRTGYDRGHMAPNYAITTRYGEKAQKKTFLMTNIAPQTPELNRGIWREIEHRTAELFTGKWGDVWVIVGAICDGQEALSGTDINIPTAFYQLIVSHCHGKIKALAFIIEQDVEWKPWPRRFIVSIDELEERTGFDFLSELDDEIEDKLESQRPTRLWPVKFFDAFKALEIHNNKK